MNTKFVVKRAFKYGEREYKPGDEWEPGEGKHDKKIIASGLVIRQDDHGKTKRERQAKK